MTEDETDQELLSNSIFFAPDSTNNLDRNHDIRSIGKIGVVLINDFAKSTEKVRSLLLLGKLIEFDFVFNFFKFLFISVSELVLRVSLFIDPFFPEVMLLSNVLPGALVYGLVAGARADLLSSELLRPHFDIKRGV